MLTNLPVEARLLPACAFFVCSALAGYADQFGDFTYVEYDTHVEVTGYPESAIGDVVIPSEIVGKPVTSIGTATFYSCTTLSSVTIPNSVTSIGKGAFSQCPSLTSVTIGNGVTSIGDSAFGWCNSLSSVTIPDGVTSIGDLTFFNCSSLTSVAIPNSVTTIGDSAFYGCTSLTSVTIGSGVTNIGDEAFMGCSSLHIVYFMGNPPLSLGEGVFEFAINATVYYLAGTTGWEATYGGRPTRLTGGERDPLIGGLKLDLVDTWFDSGWFGAYSTALAPWLFHIDHGFIYRDPQSSNAGMFVYDLDMLAWWWTTSDIYPYIYAFDPTADYGGTDINSEWLLYDRDRNSPRSFEVVTGDSAGSFLLFGP